MSDEEKKSRCLPYTTASLNKSIFVGSSFISLSTAIILTILVYLLLNYFGIPLILNIIVLVILMTGFILLIYSNMAKLLCMKKEK